MAGDEVKSILEDLATRCRVLMDLMGADPTKHGFFRGSFEAALAEAQGMMIGKAGGLVPIQSYQEMASMIERDPEGRVVRSAAMRSYDHLDQMRGAANFAKTQVAEIGRLFQRLKHLSPQASQAARQALDPIVEATNARVQLALEVEEAAVELAVSGNADRLAKVPVGVTGRSFGSLMSTQLSLSRITLLPHGVVTGANEMLARIGEMPINSDEAKNAMKDLAAKATLSLSAAAQAARSSAAAGRAVLGRTALAISEALLNYASRLTTPLLFFPESMRWPGVEDA